MKMKGMKHRVLSRNIGVASYSNRRGDQEIRRCVAQKAAANENGIEGSKQQLSKALIAASAAAAIVLSTPAAQARLEGVNKPELLPKEFTPLIDVADFLTQGEEQRLVKQVERLEADTGIKLRILAQNYPETPGLAIKDYWSVDARTVVLVADPNTGNITNFNVGDEVDIEVPRSFWSKIAGKFGNKFYWQKKGPEAAIINSVNAIDTCLREPEGRFKCAKLEVPNEED